MNQANALQCVKVPPQLGGSVSILLALAASALQSKPATANGLDAYGRADNPAGGSLLH
jgi:hypothetical protein